MCFVAKDSQRGRNNDGLGYVASLLYWEVVIDSECWYNGGSSFGSLLVVGGRQTSTPAS